MAAYASHEELSIFCRWFSTMLGAGVSQARCLDVLSQQQRSPKFKRVITDVQQEVEAGSILSKSMARHPKAFSPLCVGLVRAGEIGDALEETLSRLSAFLEKDADIQRKTKLEMTYPTIIVTAAMLIAIGLCTFIVQPFWG